MPCLSFSDFFMLGSLTIQGFQKNMRNFSRSVFQLPLATFLPYGGLFRILSFEAYEAYAEITSFSYILHQDRLSILFCTSYSASESFPAAVDASGSSLPISFLPSMLFPETVLLPLLSSLSFMLPASSFFAASTAPLLPF